ncbi:MAG TPA: DNA mismatch repair protein MutL [Tepidimicrobium sp.]|nr:DNA mismatch repair protein MutL [Tepidimicrobium sp.]
MKVDLLVAEIGSTTTVVNAFDFTPCPKFIGQGQSPTSVGEGDVNIGLKSAIENLAKTLETDGIKYLEMIATSSAAGGLRMTVHGLVYDMTVKAAKEAALGAGANIEYITAGKLRDSDLNRIEDIDPNIILIAGGVDYGERDTALYNSQLIARLNLNIPVIYAGNVENQQEVRILFEDKRSELYVVENVYPKIDQLNIEPTRRIIQGVFEKHIVHGPGMERVRDMVTGTIMPTPGAVMASSELLYDELGDLVTIDVGGATTDIHSVTEGSEEISRILISPEPLAKRTVEGDLGVYVNMQNIVNMVGKEELAKELDIIEEELEDMIENYEPIPRSEMELNFVEKLTEHAVITAIKRHAGRLRDLYGPGGKKTIAEGKDLTAIRTIIGTGGALTRLPNRVKLLKQIASSNRGSELLPTKGANIVIDNNYIMASLGVMSKEYPEEALELLKDSLDL